MYRISCKPLKDTRDAWFLHETTLDAAKATAEGLAASKLVWDRREDGTHVAYANGAAYTISIDTLSHRTR